MAAASSRRRVMVCRWSSLVWSTRCAARSTYNAAWPSAMAGASEQRIAFRIGISVGASNLLYRTAAHECPDQEIMQDLREGGMTLSEERWPIVLSTINRVGQTYNVAFQDGQVERFVHDQRHLLL